MHPSRPKLADYTSAELEAGILSGRWRGWLPQERLLAEELHVSRSTLRAALERVRRKGLIESLPKLGHRLPARPARGLTIPESAPQGQVALLMPDGIEELRYTAARWIGEFRAQLSEKGWGFRIVESKAAYSRRPSRALERLAAHSPGTCWVLRLSTREMQQWFRDAGVPCVIAGTCFPGMDLPFVDRDHRAACRHAVGRMVAAGHRYLALLVPEAQKAGDVESEKGFAEGVEAAGAGLQTTVVRMPPDPKGIDVTVNRLLGSALMPTAILVTQPENYLSVFGSLSRRGWIVPRDMSLVSCAHDSFLEHLYPQPTGYRLSPRKISDTILRLVVNQYEKISGDDAHLLLPEFVKGGTLAAPRSGRPL